MRPMPARRPAICVFHPDHDDPRPLCAAARRTAVEAAAAHAPQRAGRRRRAAHRRRTRDDRLLQQRLSGPRAAPGADRGRAARCRTLGDRRDGIAAGVRPHRLPRGAGAAHRPVRRPASCAVLPRRLCGRHRPAAGARGPGRRAVLRCAEPCLPDRRGAAVEGGHRRLSAWRRGGARAAPRSRQRDAPDHRHRCGVQHGRRYRAVARPAAAGRTARCAAGDRRCARLRRARPRRPRRRRALRPAFGQTRRDGHARQGRGRGGAPTWPATKP